MPSPLNEITSWHFQSQITLNDPAERLAALEALRIRRDSDLLMRKSAALLTDVAEEVRTAAADALISVGGKQSAELAGEYLEDPDPGTRDAAAAVLAGIGRIGAGPALRRLEHKESYVRAAAIRALGMIGARSVLDDVACLLSDPSPEVVNEAVIAMGMLEGSDYLQDLKVIYRRVPEARKAVLITLTVLDAHASLDVFEAALNSADPELRQSAEDGLHTANSPRARRILETIADNSGLE